MGVGTVKVRALTILSCNDKEPAKPNKTTSRPSCSSYQAKLGILKILLQHWTSAQLQAGGRIKSMFLQSIPFVLGDFLDYFPCGISKKNSPRAPKNQFFYYLISLLTAWKIMIYWRHRRKLVLFPDMNYGRRPGNLCEFPGGIARKVIILHNWQFRGKIAEVAPGSRIYSLLENSPDFTAGS